MSTAELVNRYVWFVTNIYNRDPISLEEIQHRFESHCGRGDVLFPQRRVARQGF